jgi:hypothetical protein
MSGFEPATFGRTFEKLVLEYQAGIGFCLAPVFHVITLILFILVIRLGNRVHWVFAIYYLLNYSCIWLYVGLVMCLLFYREMGVWSLAFWGIMPILLGNIVWQWLKEVRQPQVDIGFTRIPRWRWCILPIMGFGFWYPTFVWGQGFILNLRDILFSFYGLMPCPTTMVVLGFLALQYPKGNKALFNALTLFAVWIGTAQLALGYLPDYPLALIGYICLGLIVFNKLKRASNQVA